MRALTRGARRSSSIARRATARKAVVRALCAAALVALLVAGGFIAVRQLHRQVLTLEACGRIQEQIRERGDVQRVDGRPPLVFVLGDSYASGDTLPDYREAWSFDLASITGREVDVSAFGQTGLLSGGFCGGQSYFDRVPAIRSADPSTLVVQGGGVDGDSPPGEVEQAAIRFLHQVAGVRRVVVVGVLRIPARPDVAGLNDAWRRAAKRTGARFVSTTAWRIPIGPDGVHPTATGAERYASRVAAALHLGR